MTDSKDSAIIASWQKNAEPWQQAIQDKEISSRVLTSNQAIIDAVVSVPGSSVLDIGCGEGWLAQSLNGLGYKVSGFDVVESLVASARKTSTGEFKVLAYEDLRAACFSSKFDIAVCNFSLLGKDSVVNVFAAMASLLNHDGYFIMQTIHPCFSGSSEAYRDGWRQGSWQGFNDAFSDPAPWYFRTLQSWCKIFLKHNLKIMQLIEPLNSQSDKSASLIIVGRLHIQVGSK
ncbi:MAG: SAM-dependent methyltransferase [SAR86 cluster bacterium]|uniref:SAM-dependent methyltransferase n=1 Tax=SAR86 cluster bacterium TaxID=2030880 RepID=A0A2A4MWI4_9GAMM|nr:MAG: SAM-dependent methyltransferase [SAR86 cluster bacterium]